MTSITNNRICFNCKSLETCMLSGKYPIWHRNEDPEGTWLCAKCYANRKYKRKFATREGAYRYLSKKMRGDGNPFFGKHHTEETKNRISITKTGVPLSDQARKKMIGRKLSPEARAKLSAAFKGRPSPMLGRHHTDESKMRLFIANFGRHHTDETKRKLSEIMKRKHRQLLDEKGAERIKISLLGSKSRQPWNKGLRMSNEARRNMSIAHLGIYPSEETRKRMSQAQTGLKRKPMSELGRANIRRAQIGRKHSEETRAKMRTCSLNEAVFDIITEESVYWIGFLMADGNVSYKRDIPVVALHLKEIDLPHLEKFRMFIGSSHKIGHYVNKIWGNSSCSLSFSSERIAARLAEYGIVMRKCFVGKPIGLIDNKHFWRGVIDGDGHLGIYLRKISTETLRSIPYISLTGNLHVCIQFKAFLENTLGLFMPNIVSNKKSYLFSVSDHRALKAIELLYMDCTMALDRKLAMAKKIINSFEVIDNSRYIKRL